MIREFRCLSWRPTSRTMRPSGAKSTPHNGRHRSNNTPTRRSVICASPRYCRATFSSCSSRFGSRSARRRTASAGIETIIAKNVDINDNGFRNPAELTKQLREKLPKRPKRKPRHHHRNETVAAYQRGAKLEKRRKLMDDWAEFCAPRRSHEFTDAALSTMNDTRAA